MVGETSSQRSICQPAGPSDTRQISKLKLRHRYESATLEEVRATPADRTFTTAKRVGGRLLVVDSKFGFPPTAAVAQDRIVSIDAPELQGA